MTLSRFLSAAALSLSLLWAPSAQADTPPFFPVQGVLTDADGAALDGSVSVRFALYDALDATAALWEETRTLDVTAGAFTTYLGESVDLAPGVFRDQGSLWLGVTVESDEEMERVELGSAAYAAVAQHALEVPADVVRGDQSCGAGEVVSGLDAGGTVVCVADADADTVYSGADFALADQSCGPGDVVAGVDAAGDVVCVADADAQLTEAQVDGYVANNNYSTGSHTVVNGQPITPSSVGISGTSTSLAGGSLDLGPAVDDELTAAMVTTLTGGGSADALHSHAAQAAPGTPTTMSAESTTGMTHSAALRHCRNLTDGGFTDWKMGTLQELWSIYETAAVPNDLSINFVWTKDAVGSISTHLRFLRLSDGFVSSGQGNSNAYVRCVR